MYLWVERKQIPHLRVMGRNIRFLKSDLETFRASFKQEMEMPRARQYDGVVYRRAGTEIWWIRYRDRKGVARRESNLPADRQEANKKLRERLQARNDNLLEVIRKGETLAYRQWAISSWRTIPSRPYALRKRMKRTSGAPNTSRQLLP